MIRIAFALAAKLAMLSICLPALAQRVEVPIGQTLVGQTPRYWVSVSVGEGPTVDAMLDTGSFGLRILPRVSANAAGISDTGTVATYAYGSGVRITGTVGEAVLAIGGANSGTPVGLQLVEALDCLPDRPNCAGNTLNMAQFGFGGNSRPNEGFAAILGIDFGPDAPAGGITNPLYAMGSGTWIVELPAPGARAPGRLVINPEPPETAGYTMFPLAQGTRYGIDGCLAGGPAGIRFCGPIMLDSGAPGVVVHSATVPAARHWPDGTGGTLSFGNGGDSLAMTFTADPSAPGRAVRVQPQPSGTAIYAGILPYADFSVYYDSRSRTIGLKRRD